MKSDSRAAGVTSDRAAVVLGMRRHAMATAATSGIFLSALNQSADSGDQRRKPVIHA
jgi:hypothetical protein